jgi:hypothetical protein
MCQRVVPVPDGHCNVGGSGFFNKERGMKDKVTGVCVDIPTIIEEAKQKAKMNKKQTLQIDRSYEINIEDIPLHAAKIISIIENDEWGNMISFSNDELNIGLALPITTLLECLLDNSDIREEVLSFIHQKAVV